MLTSPAAGAGKDGWKSRVDDLRARLDEFAKPAGAELPGSPVTVNIGDLRAPAAATAPPGFLGQSNSAQHHLRC